MMTEISIRKLLMYVGEGNYDGVANNDDNIDRWAVIKLAARASSAVVATSATEVEPYCERTLSQKCCVTRGSETKF